MTPKSEPVEASVMTVRGPLPVSALGHTLPHEHLLLNQMREYRQTGLLNDMEIIASELRSFTAVGGKTIVDLTSAELTTGASQDPMGLYRGVRHSGYSEQGTRAPNNVLDIVRLSEETGVNIVLGTGHYREPYLNDSDLAQTPIDAVADQLVRDLTDGFPGTDGVRAGIIGEVAADKWSISPIEERSFRASARAANKTGVTVSTHAARWPVGIAQLDIFEEEGLNLDRVIVGHADTVHIPEYHLDIVRRGAFIQFDSFWFQDHEFLARRIGYIQRVADAGFLHRILVSHDVCLTSHQQQNGGCGFVVVAGALSEALVSAGFSESEVHQLIVSNPASALVGG